MVESFYVRPETFRIGLDGGFVLQSSGCVVLVEETSTGLAFRLTTLRTT